jgi:hypothetical protein
MKNKATKRPKIISKQAKKKTRRHKNKQVQKVMRGGLLTTSFGFGGETVSETTGAKIYNRETGEWENQSQHQVGPFKWSTQEPSSESESESESKESESGSEEKSSTPKSVIIAGVIIVGAIVAKIVTGK